MADVTVLASADVPARRLCDVRALLGAAFAGAFSADDWEHCLGGWHVLVVSPEGTLLSHAAVVPRVLEIAGKPVDAGYVEGVATAPVLQGRGFGTAAMRAVGDLLAARFEMGALSTSRPGFYERLGWQRWQGPSFVRRGAQLVRTPDEDDGIMVLRHDATLPVELTDPIACHERSGDDW
jgi:aminoglycoside 2'-N-acetyltransferase I